MEFFKNALKEVGDNIKKEVSKGQVEQEEKFKKEKTFKATKKIGKIIAFDDVNKMFMTPCGAFNKRVYEYSQILDFELLEDGESITQGGMGKSLVGGMLFGGVGAIVGSTGKKKTKSICNSLKVKISVNDMKTPSIMIDFLITPVKKSSSIYKASFKNAHECISILNIACQGNDTNSVDTNTNIDNSNSSSVADEILKFKSLLDCGAITQEEFDKKKRELL